MTAALLIFLHTSVHASEDTEESDSESTTYKKEDVQKSTQKPTTNKLRNIPNFIKTTPSINHPTNITDPRPPSEELPKESDWKRQPKGDDCMYARMGLRLVLPEADRENANVGLAFGFRPCVSPVEIEFGTSWNIDAVQTAVDKGYGHQLDSIHHMTALIYMFPYRGFSFFGGLGANITLENPDDRSRTDLTTNPLFKDVKNGAHTTIGIAYKKDYVGIRAEVRQMYHTLYELPQMQLIAGIDFAFH